MSKEKSVDNAVKNYKSKPPVINGLTLINHALRVQMGLGCMEYVLMESILYLKERNKPVTDYSVYVLTGLVPQEATMSLEMLVKKGFIFPQADVDGSPNISNKWASFFSDIEKEFDDFWAIDGSNCWPGSKPKAQDLYTNLRKSKTKDFLFHQRDQYFKFLEFVNKNGFDRSKMMCTVFLGKQERYMENWTEAADKEEKKFKAEENHPLPAEPSTETKQSRKAKYEN